MALIIRELLNYYKYALRELPDNRVQDWFLMNSPWPMLTISVVYLYVILDCGPKIMQNRKPFHIDKLLIWYNAMQILGCLFIVVEGTKYGISKYNLKCEPVDFSNSPDSIYIAKIVWFYFILKLIDLLDTVFFIMRKKESQISFLHVYHHWGMSLLSWAFTKFLPGGTTLYVVVINSFVHIIMYAYYLLTAYDKRYKQSIWWKKHITQLQLFQFGILLVQHVQLLIFQSDCQYPKGILWLFIPQNLTIFSLFGDFYYKTYIKKPQKNVQ